MKFIALQTPPRRRPFFPRNWLALAAAVCAIALVRPCAAQPLVRFTAQGPLSNPFINLVRLHMDDSHQLDHVQFTIAPKPGSVTRPLSARYSSAYLLARGYLNAKTGEIDVPVFGTYQEYTNSVKVVSTFVDGTSQTNYLSVPTGKYKGGIYNHPVIAQARTSDTSLSYDYIMLKSYAYPNTPVIIDTDGEIRWVGTADTATSEVIFYDNSFFLVARNGTTLERMEFDGTVTKVADYAAAGVTLFTHNLDFGKRGIIADVNTSDYVESVNIEVDTAGNILHTWNLADIITQAMIAGGDDPTQFVAAKGSMMDWFHNNCAAYRPSDDSIVISSRENFVIALDYETGAIKWILGDPTKEWYEFPSLRKYALKLEPGTKPPIGQHALSFYHDKLLLFDDGDYSADHFPKGVTRTSSAPRKYKINEVAGTATEIWTYRADPAIFSPITSSVYEDLPGSYLVDYSTADNYSYAEILGLNPAGAVVFDYRFTEKATTATAWNAVPVHFEDLVFD